MTISKKAKIVIWIIGILISLILLMLGMGVMDEISQIRLEGSDL